jgi:hypothetical protein
MKVCFLLDENLPPHLKTALRRFDPVIDILRVGDEGAPALGAFDPDILHYLGDSRRFLVTDNRCSMFTHLDVHWANGGHVWGCAVYGLKHR